MINLNGKLYTDLSEIPKDFHSFFSTTFHLEETLRFENGAILFWELHYFRLMAAMRRMRYPIPPIFTMDHLEAEIKKTLPKKDQKPEGVLIRFKILSVDTPNQKSNKNICFFIETNEVKSLKTNTSEDKFVIDLYKDAFVLSGLLSNLTLINAPLRKMVEVFAIENGLNDCFLLNDQKELVETTLGTPYLIKGKQWATPNIMSGCQNLTFRTAFNSYLNEKLPELELQERVITPFELQQADEILIISLEWGAISVTNYRKSSYQTVKGQEIMTRFLSTLT